jgi:hypothetical protein
LFVGALRLGWALGLWMMVRALLLHAAALAPFLITL